MDKAINESLHVIQFPCDYPIRIVGNESADFEEVVTSIVEKHTRKMTKVSVKRSKQGNYLSVLVMILATGEEQLKKIHEELMSSGRVQMVL